MVCIPFPEETVTDRLLRAEVMVLAREDPDKPFSYAAVEVLKGDPGELQIDLFVDSATRRRLALDPGLSMVLTFEGRRGWRSVGFATPSYRALVGEILLQSPTWSRSGRNESRARFFLPYLVDANPVIQKLAYLEVGRASYDLIRRADTVVPAAQVQGFLADPRYLEWHALYILLLGVDASPEEAEAIRAQIRILAVLDSTLNLGAWATALIEVDGVQAVERLEAVYLGNPDRDPQQVLEIVKALSVHGARQRSGLRERIAESYGVLIRTHPTLAGWAARDLTAWQDWRFAEPLAELRTNRSDMDGATAYAIDYYIGRAGSKAAN